MIDARREATVNTAVPGSATLSVLVVHSWYTTGPVSGVNRVAEDEMELLRRHGHHVDYLTAVPAVD